MVNYISENSAFWSFYLLRVMVLRDTQSIGLGWTELNEDNGGRIGVIYSRDLVRPISLRS